MVRHKLPETIRFSIRTLEIPLDMLRDAGSEILAVVDHPPGLHLGPYTEEDVCHLLWREDRVPEWIDVSVCWVTEGYTLIELKTSYFYTEGQTLRPKKSGIPPFRIYTVRLPVAWESVEKSGKVDLKTCPSDTQ